MHGMQELEDFIESIGFVRHQARAIIVSLKLFEESMRAGHSIDGLPLHVVIARSVREKALEIAVWAAALEKEDV